MSWNPAFAVGHPLIDAQHKELFDRLDALLEATARGQQEMTLEMLNFLLDYVAFHFSAEEELMAEWGYAELAYHRELHREFKRDLGRMEQEIHAGAELFGTASNLAGLVSEWLSDHILTEDREMVPFLREHPPT